MAQETVFNILASPIAETREAKLSDLMHMLLKPDVLRLNLEYLKDSVHDMKNN